MTEWVKSAMDLMVNHDRKSKCWQLDTSHSKIVKKYQVRYDLSNGTVIDHVNIFNEHLADSRREIVKEIKK